VGAVRVAAVVALCAVLAGCLTPRVVIETVEIPVPGPCPAVTVPARPPLPVMGPQLTDAERLRALVLALAIALGYAEELETLLRAASKEGP